MLFRIKASSWTDRQSSVAQGLLLSALPVFNNLNRVLFIYRVGVVENTLFASHDQEGCDVNSITTDPLHRPGLAAGWVRDQTFVAGLEIRNRALRISSPILLYHGPPRPLFITRVSHQFCEKNSVIQNIFNW